MTAVDPPGRFLAKGDQNDHVYALQQLLGHLGLYQGEQDGYFGDALEDAVRQFQHAFGHDEDGQAGDELWHEIAHEAASQGYGQHHEEEPAPAGQLSEDGAWRWDGTEWQPVEAPAAPAEQPASVADKDMAVLTQDQFHELIAASITVHGNEA